jgi:cytochrome c oxidase subunit 2
MIHAALALRRLTDRRLPAALSLACAACLVLAAIPHPAFAGILLPEHGAGSREADDINTLYVITLFIALPIFVGVEGVLIYSLVRHRARRGAPQPAQVRGNTRLETSWTVAAALILVIIAVFTFVLLPAIRTPERGGLERAGTVQVAAVGQPPVPGGPTMHVRVVGQQYLWRYDYPGPDRMFSYHTMVVPTNTTITLDITSSDVIHSFWIPKLFGKADAVPGYHNDMWFKVEKEGTYRGNCAELCGENHAQMIGEVKAVSPDAFRAWAARQRADIAASRAALAAQRRKLGVGLPGAGAAKVPQ